MMPMYLLVLQGCKEDCSVGQSSQSADHGWAMEKAIGETMLSAAEGD